MADIFIVFPKLIDFMLELLDWVDVFYEFISSVVSVWSFSGDSFLTAGGFSDSEPIRYSFIDI